MNEKEELGSAEAAKKLSSNNRKKSIFLTGLQNPRNFVMLFSYVVMTFYVLKFVGHFFMNAFSPPFCTPSPMCFLDFKSGYGAAITFFVLSFLAFTSKN